jgi:cysteine desulfurase
MAVNNEVGAVQPVWEISTLLRDRSIHFHVDGVQAVGKIHLDVHGLGVDTLSFAAHKFHGPKGVGGLYIKKGVAIEPLLHGGGQENGLRGGTEAAALIVSMGAAADFAGSTLSEHVLLAARFRDKLKGLLSEHVPGVSFHGPTDPCRQAPNTLSVSIDGIRAEALAAILDQMHGIQISLGAACASNRHASLSHVLVAMGLGEPVIKATIRISFGRYTTEVELEHLVDAIAQGVQALQRIAKSVNHE